MKRNKEIVTIIIMIKMETRTNNRNVKVVMGRKKSEIVIQKKQYQIFQI